MDTIKQFLKLHSPTAQSLSAVWAALAILWATNSQFHDYLFGAFNALPKGMHAFVVGIIIPLCILWRTQRKNVAVAEAAPGEIGTASASASVKPLIMLLVALLIGASAHAQAVSNLYMAGASYSAGAQTAPVAGSALYAHAITTGTTGMYAFTAIDAVPNTLHPFTVTSNIGVGVAEKLFTVDGISIFVPTSAGISWSGTNTGWQWSAGAGAPIKLKTTADGGAFYIMPTVRVLKSSVSNGTGYQPIIGILFGWGK